MPDGEAAAVDSETHSAASSVADDGAGNSPIGLCDLPQTTDKDPRKIARKYQLELCKKAIEENIIVYLGTGCGKTHIAVLLMYELAHLIRKPQKSVFVFLAPTVPLVQQQARVIEESLDLKVSIHLGGNRRLKNHLDWEKEITEFEILVMTPQILLHNLHHCFITMELISLLIFDECHHAQAKSNHPYAQIMKVFYESKSSKLPRIFGMTASPIVGKGASSQENLPKAINSLENLLNAKVYSVENLDELQSFVASPVVKVYYYGPVMNTQDSSIIVYENALEEIKQKCISSFSKKKDNHQSPQSLREMKRRLNKKHDSILYCLANLGIWGALQVTSDEVESNNLMDGDGSSGDHSVYDMYLSQAAKVFASHLDEVDIASDLSSEEVLKEPFFSRKLLRLVGILSTFRLQPNMKGIIFVDRIETARLLSRILKNLPFLASWKPDFMVGVNAGLKSMSRKTMHIILDKFRSGELNLLVATKVGEEGLDIQTCSLVIRFDLPETVSSFIQSRGRARMPKSEYAFLVDSGNQKELDLIEKFTRDENRMNAEVSSRSSTERFSRIEERIYKVDITGASASFSYSVSLLHQYCSRLPHDEFFDPKPNFYCFSDLDGLVCHIVLPSNAPINHVVGTPQPSSEEAKKDACLKAIEELHKLGVLNDYLLPESKDEDEEALMDTACHKDDASRGELYEMCVPSLLKIPWDTSGCHISLHSYYIKFKPDPVDRIYKKFGLFLGSPLPTDAEDMEIDLHLARHRSVFTKLIPAGITVLDKDEINQAELFQEIWLKVLIDRSELVGDLFSLGRRDFDKSKISTFYLFLPINMQSSEHTLTIDWKIIKRCLSSPLFKNSSDGVESQSPSTGTTQLKLANGSWSFDDVKNSLVYAAYKKQFYIVLGVVRERNGNSPRTESSTESHLDDIFNKFGICLKHPEQSLLYVKPLFNLRNLLLDRKPTNSEPQELEEYFTEVPPELCQMKILGFSNDLGSSLSLLPSIMHRLENLLVAIELKNVLSAGFPEGAEVTTHRVLEALTTETCQERLSLERLEILGDAFLKFAVGRHLFLLHDRCDEGALTQRRSNVVRNSNLFRLAIRRNLQVYIRDQMLDPAQFFAVGRPCPVICDEETQHSIHCPPETSEPGMQNTNEIRCSKSHHWLPKKTIADAVEALVGAFIVDSGFRAATAFLRWIGINVDFDPSQVKKACLASKSYMPLAARVDVPALEDLLGHKFLHKGLLLQAFLHPSYSLQGGGCYQRLEYIGDAVLDFLVTSYLFTAYPNLKPGHLTDLRSLSVSNMALANISVTHSFYKFLVCSSGKLNEAVTKYADFLAGSSSEEDLVVVPKCPKVLGDLIESSFGAILLDTGFNLNYVWKVMLSLLNPIKTFSTIQIQVHPIRDLLEQCQFNKWGWQFSDSKKNGAFCVEAKVSLESSCLTTSVVAPSKKEASRKAAHLMLLKLKAQGFESKSNSLKKVLMTSVKREPRLIGYDQAPVDITDLEEMELEGLKLEEANDSCFDSKRNSQGENIPFSIKPIITQTLSKGISDRNPGKNISEKRPDNPALATVSGGGIRKTAKSKLVETCVANYWKPPVYECCNEDGPAHLKSFTYKVSVEVEEGSDIVLECFSGRKSNKKAAAEQAAEAALWYLEKAKFLL